MNLEKHFNPKRFANYIKYDLFLNGKTYAYFGIGLCVAIFANSFFFISTHSTYRNFNEYDYLPSFFLVFALSSVLLIGNSFNNLRDKKQKSHFLTLPVSVFEKFLSEFILKFIPILSLFTPLYWILFKFTHYIYDLFPWKRPVTVDSFEMLDPFKDLGLPLDQMAAVLSIFSLATFLFAGASYFKKFALVKTILSFGILIAFFIANMIVFSHLFFDNPRNDFFYIEFPDYKIRKGLYNIQLMFYILGMASSLFLLPLAYFNLKEKQA